MLWLALYFPDLPIEVFAAPDNSPKTAFVVLEEQRVAHCNAAAAASGIGLGCTLATAHSICPQLKHQRRDTAAEAQRLVSLANQLYRFSHHVSIQNPDCLILEIGASLKLFGSHPQLIAQAEQLCLELGHRPIVKASSTPWAAIALARSGAEQLSNIPLLSAGLEMAGIADAVIERLGNMGLRTLGQLLNLPTGALGKRFGTNLLTYLGQLRGDQPDPRAAITPAPRFRESLHLLQPISDKQTLFIPPFSPMQKLARELQHWLITHQLGCEQLLWHFASHADESVVMPVQFAHGKQQANDLMHISELALARATLPAEVLSVSLEAKQVCPWRSPSNQLFSSAAATDTDMALTDLIDELSARFGAEACHTLAVLDQHTPEAAWVKQPLNPSRQAANTTDLALSPRPLWLFDQPHRVEKDQLTLLHGPERIQSQWWSTQPTERDYYIAQHQAGGRCWAFVDAQSNWYLHGYFA